MTASAQALSDYEPITAEERAARNRLLELAAGGDPFARSLPLHLTCSALVVHPATRRILLRWHPRIGAWMQVGGHGDSGEVDPFPIARREAAEETGLDDLRSYPDASCPVIVQVAVVQVPLGAGEPAHEHGDVRYLLATDQPHRAAPETPDAPLRWCSEEQANALVTEENLRLLFQRTWGLLDSGV